MRGMHLSRRGSNTSKALLVYPCSPAEPPAAYLPGVPGLRPSTHPRYSLAGSPSELHVQAAVEGKRGAQVASCCGEVGQLSPRTLSPTTKAGSSEMHVTSRRGTAELHKSHEERRTRTRATREACPCPREEGCLCLCPQKPLALGFRLLAVEAGCPHGSYASQLDSERKPSCEPPTTKSL